MEHQAWPSMADKNPIVHRCPYLVVHPTNRKWVIPSYVSGHCPHKNPVYNQDCNPLTIRGMSHHVDHGNIFPAKKARFDSRGFRFSSHALLGTSGWPRISSNHGLAGAAGDFEMWRFPLRFLDFMWILDGNFHGCFMEILCRTYGFWSLDLAPI